MKQLIMGAAYGYTTELLEPFVKSLRRHYNGDCVLITHPLSPKELEFYAKNNIITFELETPISNPKDIQVARYSIYRDIFDTHFDDVEHILICDIRDVMFQDNPFKFPLTSDVEFFLEPALFKNCTANAPWIRGIYGDIGLEVVLDEYVICSGTTMGTRKGIVNYLDEMIKEIDRIRATGRLLYQGEDQPIHNHLVYGDTFPDCVMHHNGQGAITTIHHQQQLTFDRKGRLLNEDGAPTPIIHQWDRADACKSVLETQALNG
jgi:hypothetical protein